MTWIGYTLPYCGNFPITSLLNTSIAHIALFSYPLLTIWFIKPYRKLVISWLCAPIVWAQPTALHSTNKHNVTFVNQPFRSLQRDASRAR